MGLLDKTNPHATRKSVVQHAVIGSVVAPAGMLLFIWSRVPTPYWWMVLLPAAAFGAAVFALMEWQLDDGPDEDEEG